MKIGLYPQLENFYHLVNMPAVGRLQIGDVSLKSSAYKPEGGVNFDSWGNPIDMRTFLPSVNNCLQYVEVAEGTLRLRDYHGRFTLEAYYTNHHRERRVTVLLSDRTPGITGSFIEGLSSSDILYKGMQYDSEISTQPYKVWAKRFTAFMERMKV